MQHSNWFALTLTLILNTNFISTFASEVNASRLNVDRLQQANIRAQQLTVSNLDIPIARQTVELQQVNQTNTTHHNHYKAANPNNSWYKNVSNSFVDGIYQGIAQVGLTVTISAVSMGTQYLLNLYLNSGQATKTGRHPTQEEILQQLDPEQLQDLADQQQKLANLQIAEEELKQLAQKEYFLKRLSEGIQLCDHDCEELKNKYNLAKKEHLNEMADFLSKKNSKISRQKLSPLS